MTHRRSRLAGVELYFEHLERARRFYTETLGFELTEHKPAHHAKLGLSGGFLCLEQKGVESFPSMDKAVVFMEVADLRVVVERVGSADLVGTDPSAVPPWAAVRDPEGHTILLLQAPGSTRPTRRRAPRRGRP